MLKRSPIFQTNRFTWWKLAKLLLIFQFCIKFKASWSRHSHDLSPIGGNCILNDTYENTYKIVDENREKSLKSVCFCQFLYGIHLLGLTLLQNVHCIIMNICSKVTLKSWLMACQCQHQHWLHNLKCSYVTESVWYRMAYFVWIHTNIILSTFFLVRTRLKMNRYIFSTHACICV